MAVPAAPSPRRRRMPRLRVFKKLDLPAFRGHLKRRKKKHVPLTQKQWRDAFEVETGRLIEGEKILKRVRHGGVETSIRAEVWPFLLNFYDLESTEAQRDLERTMKREEYDDLKRKCTLLRENIAFESRQHRDCGGVFVDTSPAGAYKNRSFNLRKEETGPPQALYPSNSKYLRSFSSREPPEWQQGEPGCTRPQPREEFMTWQRIIRLDALRMNAEWVPYSPSQASVTKVAASQLAMDVGLKEDDHLEPCVRHHAARLVAILEAYAVYDPETGYCQGMGDLLSPFVALLEEDYLAFWCFACFMYTVRENFRTDELGIRRQLLIISRILKLGDPQLYKHLVKIQAADCFFIYRMVVVLMRRELSFEQTISFWEILWADKTSVRLGKVKVFCRKGRRIAPPTADLLLYVIVAAIRQKRTIILEKCKSMDDVLKECNNMSGSMDVWALLGDARDLVISVHERFKT